MRPVVLDTSVALPAVLSPRGYRRRFLVLLAFGALAARRELARRDAELLQNEAVSAGGKTGGPSLQMLVEQADARYERLSKRLPSGCPDDWRLAGSGPLLGEYERKLRQAGPRLDPSLGPERIEVARRQLEIVCAEMTDSFQPGEIPHYTGDRDDDPIVHTALLADATWLIADDRRHIATSPDGIVEYQLPASDRHVSAVTFSTFLTHLTDIDLDEVDPSLLALAFAPLAR